MGGWETWVVLDGFSEDNTTALALRSGAKVAAHYWEGWAKQRMWALQELARREWVLWLDADEVVDEALRTEIERFCANAPSDVAGALILRKLIFLGRHIRHGGMWPRRHLRLVRRSAAWVAPAEVDERWEVAGRTVRLRGAIVHDDRRGLEEWVRRHVRYAKLHPLEPRLYRTAPRCYRALGYFLHRYVWQLGFLDGKEGLVFHAFHALFYRLLRDALEMEAHR